MRRHRFLSWENLRGRVAAVVLQTEVRQQQIRVRMSSQADSKTYWCRWMGWIIRSHKISRNGNGAKCIANVETYMSSTTRPRRKILFFCTVLTFRNILCNFRRIAVNVQNLKVDSLSQQ